MPGDDASNFARSWIRAELDSPESFVCAGFRVAVWTRAARSRHGAPNEDALAIRAATGVGVFVVADGVGGQHSGDEASEALVTTIHQLQGDALSARGCRPAILDALERSHRTIAARIHGAATTAIVVAAVADRLRTFNAGDSGAALFARDGEVLHQTIGHSTTHYALEAGALEHEAMLDAPGHHLVSNVIGMNPMTVDVTAPISFRQSDTLALVSDGVLDNVWWPAIGEIVARGPLARAASNLAAAVEARLDDDGKDDDRSFILVRRLRRRSGGARHSPQNM